MFKKNKDIYIFLASVILLIIVSVTIISALEIIKIYITPNTISAKNVGEIKNQQPEQKLKDPLIIPAPK